MTNGTKPKVAATEKGHISPTIWALEEAFPDLAHLLQSSVLHAHDKMSWLY